MNSKLSDYNVFNLLEGCVLLIIAVYCTALKLKFYCEPSFYYKQQL